MEKKLDCRGLQCPEPVIRCRTLLKEDQPDVVQVLVDNPAALENVGRFLGRNGFKISSTRLGDNEWRIDASKDGTAPSGQCIAEPETNAVKTLVLLTTEGIGQGDDELGAKLMNMFLKNLSELGSSLWRIILLNGAVKLSATQGDALKALEDLEKAGVDVLVCGTCLTHYGLLEKKRVGETTNMMDVITSLSMADKVIRP